MGDVVAAVVPDVIVSGYRIETGTAVRPHACWGRVLPQFAVSLICMVNSLPEG
jgi:hypothetical protein